MYLFIKKRPLPSVASPKVVFLSEGICNAITYICLLCLGCQGIELGYLSEFGCNFVVNFARGNWAGIGFNSESERKWTYRWLLLSWSWFGQWIGLTLPRTGEKQSMWTAIHAHRLRECSLMLQNHFFYWQACSLHFGTLPAVDSFLLWKKKM